MKKNLCLIVCVLVCFMSACLPSKDVVNGGDEYRELIASGKHYRIYKGDVTQVYYSIYDANGQIVLSEATEHPLKINMLNDDIVDISVGMGTGLTTHRYYSVNQNAFSEEFSYVLSNFNKLVAYIDVPKESPLEDRKIIVQDVFDKDSFYKEFKLDFSHIDTPVTDAIFSKDGTKLQLTYLSGEEQKEVSSVLELG